MLSTGEATLIIPPTPIAVSYTHLDVYKRQKLMFLKIEIPLLNLKLSKKDKRIFLK